MRIFNPNGGAMVLIPWAEFHKILEKLPEMDLWEILEAAGVNPKELRDTTKNTLINQIFIEFEEKL